MTREVVVVSAVRTAIGALVAASKMFPYRARRHCGARIAGLCQRGWAKTWATYCLASVVNTGTQRYVPLARGCISGGCVQGTLRLQRQPPVRLGPAGHRVSAAQVIQLGDADIAIGAGAETYEPRALRQPGQCALVRVWATQKCVDMMVGAATLPNHPHGRDGRKHCRQVGHQPRRARPTGRGKYRRAQKATEAGILQRANRAGDAQNKKAKSLYNTDEHFRTDATLEDMAKLKPVFVEKRHRHGRQRFGHQRCCCCRGADGCQGGTGPWCQSRWPAWWPTRTPGSIRSTWALAPCRHATGAEESRPHRGRPGRGKPGAFAAQACAVSKDLGPDPAKVQPQRLGHLAGATRLVPRAPSSPSGAV